MGTIRGILLPNLVLDRPRNRVGGYASGSAGRSCLFLSLSFSAGRGMAEESRDKRMDGQMDSQVDT